MHDIGKIGIPDYVLLKPGKLDAGEWETMKKHTEFGDDIIGDDSSSLLQVSRTIARTHHEKWDGTGYPGHIDPITEKAVDGFQGPGGKPLPKKREEIPLYGRIVAIADVYDALCSQRSYKQPWKEERILQEMHRSSGTHFDPEVAEAFFYCLDIIKSISRRYPDETA